jgi:hypothetical protein
MSLRNALIDKIDETSLVVTCNYDFYFSEDEEDEFIDDVESEYNLGEDGQCFILNYKNAKSEKSLRRIRIKSIATKDDILFLKTYCFERRAARTFSCDRLISLADLNGEIIPDPLVFLVDYLGIPETFVVPQREKGNENWNAIRNEFRSLMRLLKTVALSDGVLHPAETQASLNELIGYIEESGKTLSLDDNSKLRVYFLGLKPSKKQIEQSFAWLDKQENSYAEKIFTSMCIVAQSDQAVHKKEIDLICEAAVSYAARAWIYYMIIILN